MIHCARRSPLNARYCGMTRDDHAGPTPKVSGRPVPVPEATAFCLIDSYDRNDRYHRFMELRQLAHFVAVAEERHFTRAARRVHVVQSTLSASINSLERELGAALLIRGGWPCRPHDRGPCAAAGRAKGVSSRRRCARCGRRCARPAAWTADYWSRPSHGHHRPASAACSRVREHYPGINLELRHGAVDGLVRATVDGELDLAFVNRPYDGRRVHEVLLGIEFLVLAVA